MYCITGLTLFYYFVVRGISGTVVKRLKLTSEKLNTLAEGILSIASSPDPLNRLHGRTELAEELILDRLSCPIGMLARLCLFTKMPALALCSLCKQLISYICCRSFIGNI